MDCADEASLLRHALQLPGVVELNFDLVGRRVDVAFDESAITRERILAAVAGTGLSAHTHGPGEHVSDDHHSHTHHHDSARWWTVASGVTLAVGWSIDNWHAASFHDVVFGAPVAPSSTVVAIYAMSALTGLWPMWPRALTALRFRRLDMHVLVCLSAIGAAVIGQWGEAAAVAFLFAVAHLLESWSIARARAEVARLVGHEPGWGDDGHHRAAEVERWIERFAAVYTPVVTFSAVAVALVPPLVDGDWSVWFYRALIFLVLACPCALVISTPVTVVAAVTSAARRGVLFKGGGPLERSAAAKAATIDALADVGVVARCRTNLTTPLDRVDVVLTCDHPEDVEFLVAHAKRALSAIRQNVGIAMATKAAFLISALFGAAPLWLAVLADTGATVAVTLNGLRLLRTKPSASVLT
jgi:cation transport ATPase